MGYQALYRVWRPQRFDDIAGQQAITQTLKNALVQKKTSHAYLFTGPRGTGKTSAAKIVAKAINCPNSTDGEPCNQCDTCKAITNGQLNDVIEIDAASNNGVEEIRDIRDKAKYAPTVADYKVYIIDEVHMLSTGAFNALLKTLEEPPQNVIFILATTEPHKIPLTIISRTQRFDFKRITIRAIVDRMTYILQQEDIAFEPDSLQIIARAAEGGMRDALSILDQAISYGDDEVTVKHALSVTGSLTQDKLIAYFDAVVEKDTEKGLSLLQEIMAEGKDATRFVEDLILFSRDLLVYQQAPAKADILEAANADESFVTLSRTISAEVLYAIIDQLNKTQYEMKLTNHAAVYLEVATVRLTQMANSFVQPAKSEETAAESQKIQQLETSLQDLKQQLKTITSQQQPPASKPVKKVTKQTNGVFKPDTSGIYSVLGVATKQNLIQLQDIWPDLLNTLSVTQRAVMKASTPVAASPEGLIVSFDYDILCKKAVEDEELAEAIRTGLNRLVGYAPKMFTLTADQWPAIRSDYLKHHKKQLRSEKKQLKTAENEEEQKATQSPVSAESSENSQKVDPAWESLDTIMPQDDEEEADANENAVVSEAVELFGKEIVEVHNS
ncbi:MAG: DNA polymerase III subunit gamma/tau [Pisciglobus halotolerans]|nr:DNA polymerase III subunit gamma/tau [Pisciglobus halotolerans]